MKKIITIIVSLISSLIALLVGSVVVVATAMFEVVRFAANNFLAVFSVLWIALFALAVLSPRDPNFISQDDSRHPINNEL